MLALSLCHNAGAMQFAKNIKWYNNLMLGLRDGKPSVVKHS